MSAYQPIQIHLGLQSLSDYQADIEATYIDQIIILITTQSIWLWQGPEHALAWYVERGHSQIMLSTRTPTWTTSADIDRNRLDEVAFFGHGLSPHTLLANVDRILPGQWYEYAVANCHWDNALSIGTPEPLALLPVPERDLLSREVRAGDDTQAAERSLHEQLPHCARHTLTPVTTTLLPQLSLSLQAFDHHHGFLPLNISSRQALGIECRIGDWFAMFKNDRKRLKQRVKDCYQHLAVLQPGADQTTLDQLAWQHYGWPQLQHQLRSLAQMQGKVLSFSYIEEPTPVFHFTRQSRPLNNLLEGFQRLYFYSSDGLQKLGFFMPPLMSKALINPLLKSPTLKRQSLPLMMLTLDYLLRFHSSALPHGEHHD